MSENLYQPNMLIEFFKKVGSSKWLPWIGLTPILIFLVCAIIVGEGLLGIAGVAFLASMPLGVAVGGFAAHRLSRKLFPRKPEIEQRLTQSLSALGFLSLPSFVGWAANSYLDAGIDMYSLKTHLFWACVVSGGFFLIKLSSSKT